MTLRPFFPFYGSKWNVARYYPPPVGEVIEPFAGSAGYATFYGCQRVRLFDADPIIAGVWSYLLRVSAREILALPDMPTVGDSVDNYALPQEAKWLIGFWLNRGSAAPKKSRTAYSARTERAQLVWGRRAKERIVSQLEAVSGWSITCASYDAAPDVAATWFIDPPYVVKGRFYRVPVRATRRAPTVVRAAAGPRHRLRRRGRDVAPVLPTRLVQVHQRPFGRSGVDAGSTAPRSGGGCMTAPAPTVVLLGEIDTRKVERDCAKDGHVFDGNNDTCGFCPMRKPWNPAVPADLCPPREEGQGAT